MTLSPRLSDELRALRPETYDLLQRANLTLHPAVTRVVLSGSRGLAGLLRRCSM